MNRNRIITVSTIGKSILVLSTIVCVLLCACSAQKIAGGNSSQTGNNGMLLAAVSQTICGTTIPHAYIAVYADSFLPYKDTLGFSDSTLANDSGHFSFSNLAPGYYNVFVDNRAKSRGGMAFVQKVPVFKDSVFSDTLDSLAQSGFVAGNAVDSMNNPLFLSYIFIKGSPFYTLAKSNGGFLLGPVPEGKYKVGLFADYQNIKLGPNVMIAKSVVDTGMATVYPDSTSVCQF